MPDWIDIARRIYAFEWVDAAANWLKAHDQSLDLWTIWLVCGGVVVWTSVKLGSRLALRGTDDETGVGVELKRQKVAEVLMGTALATLYGLTLWAYYDDMLFDFWPRVGLRVFLVIGVWAAAVFGVRFIAALVREHRRDATP